MRSPRSLLMLLMLTSVLLACGSASSGTKRDTSTIGTTPIETTDHGLGVSMTDGGRYDERYDPSGWSGASSPGGIGGGPAVEAPPVIADPGAKKPEVPKSTPPKPADILPEGKELDTTPLPKDLEF